MTQLDLLAAKPQDAPVRPDKRMPEPRKGKAFSDAQRILARLQRGPVSLLELCGDLRVAASYRQRISDIRRMGYQVTCDRNEVTGETWYRMEKV